MKRLIFLLACWAGIAWADVSPADFHYVAEILEAPEKGGLARIEVSPDLFAHSLNYPHDIRIFDADTKQWPFYLVEPSPRVESGRIGLELKNPVEGTNLLSPYRQVDLIFPDGMVHDEVEIETSGDNFIRRVEVYTDYGDRLIGEGYLIRDDGISSHVVRYSKSDASLITVRVYPSVENERESFEIKRVRSQKSPPVERGYREVVFEDLEMDAREAVQTFGFDFGSKQRRVDRVQIHVQEQSFVRAVRFYGRNSESEEWRFQHSREMYRLPKSEQVAFSLTTRTRFLKAEILNRDNLPLNEPEFTFSAFPRWIVFEAATGEEAALYFGADGVRRPSYDLKKRTSRNIEDLPVLSVEALENEGYGKRVSIAKHLITIFVGLGALLLVGVVAGLLKEMKGDAVGGE